MLQLNELEIFVRAAEAGSFSGAARKLHMSQPAVSMQIHSLERRLRCSLFTREGRSVRLTESGQILLPMARDVLSRARRLEETMICLDGETAGELRIACSTTSGKYVLPRLISGFRTVHPKVTARILVTGQSSAIRFLLDGSAHLALTSTRVEHPDLECRPFLMDRIVLIVPAGHPWAALGVVKPPDLLAEKILLREESAGTRKALAAGLSRHGIRMEDLDVAMELGNAEAIEMSVEAGLGVAFVSELVAAKGLQLGTLKVVAVDGMELERSILLCASRQQVPTGAQKAFIEYAGAPENRALLNSLPVYTVISEPVETA